MNAKIKVNDCVKIFKTGKIKTVAIRKLKCNFYAGEIAVIMGPSGSGKTTFLNILGGLDRCDSGEIIYNDKDITQFTEEQLQEYRAKVGILFQFFNLFPELTAKENIELPMIIQNTPQKKIKNRTQALLEQIQLTSRAKHKPNELSGGEQQKIAFVVALANQPEILLCDEPTGELDTKSTLNILKLLQQQIEKNPNLTIIIVTHDPIFKEIANRLYYIKDGQIIYEMNQEEIHKELNVKNKDSVISQNNNVKDFDRIIEKEKMIEELLEIENMIRNKIKNLKK